MEDREQDERRRKVEAGRAKLAQFRQRKTKGDSTSSKKKASKRKSSAVHAAVQEKEEEECACAVETPDSQLPSDLEQSTESRAGSNCTEAGAGVLDPTAERELSSWSAQKKPVTELTVQEQVPKDSISSLATEPSEFEVPRAQAKIKMLEEKLVGKQEDIDLLSQEVGELQVRLAQCSEAAQLQQNSELLKSKMPTKEGSSRPQPPAAALLQSPQEPSPSLQVLYPRARDLDMQLGSSQENIREKESVFAQMEEHLKCAVQEPSQVVGEKDGMIGHLPDQSRPADAALASLQPALSVKDSATRELKQGKRDCVEESQTHPQKEVCRPLQDLRQAVLEEEPERGVTGARKACGDAVDGKHRKADGPTKPGAPPVIDPRDREPQSLSGVNINLNDQLHEPDLHRDGLCATPERPMAAFQEERTEAEQVEKGVLEDFKRKLSSPEKHSEEAWHSKGEEGHQDEVTQTLSSRVQGLNGELLGEPENSRHLQLEPVEEVTACDTKLGWSEQEERMLLCPFDAQEAELESVQSKLCLWPRESLGPELEYQGVLKRFSLESGEENRSLKLDVNEDDRMIDGEASMGESMMEGAGDLMEKYLVCTEQQDHLSESETSEYFDIETALQGKSVRESLGFISQELFLGSDEKMDSDALSEADSFADSVTNRQSGSGFSLGDLSEISELMGKDKVYPMQDGVKLHQFLREKELALKNFSQEIEEAEERWWEGGHSLPIGPNQERGSSLFCDEIVPRLEEVGEDQIEPGAAAGSMTDLRGSFVAAPRALLWLGMAKVFQEEVERRAGKMAPDSVHLRALAGQAGARLQVQPGTHEAQSHMSAGCLGQKTALNQSLLQEVEALRAEIAIKEDLFPQTIQGKNTWETSFSKDRENFEGNILELTEKMKSLEKGQGHEQIEMAGPSKSAPSEGQKLDAETKAKESDFMQAENDLIQPMVSLGNAQEEPGWQLQAEAQKTIRALEDVQSELSSRYEEQMSQLKHRHEAERAQLRREHQKEVEDIREQMKDKLDQQQQLWDRERKEQIGLIKKIHEREHDREIEELITKHKDEMKQLREELQSRHQQTVEELQEHLHALHEAEMQQAQLQAQTLHSLELEALRLSLSNMHTAQLELSQANLIKEKETALVELREMLNDKRAQEVALVQSRLQFELEHIKDQHCKDMQQMASAHRQELADLEKKLESEMEAHAQTRETLKADWDSERALSLGRLQEELSEKHRAEMESMRAALSAQLAGQKAELDKMGRDKAQAEAALLGLQAEHQAALKDLRQELQLQHAQALREMDLKVREKQQELDVLQASCEELQARYREEIQQLWSQLDSTRANRQELNELKEQLLARASHVEQIEHLKHDFEQRKSEHETELEQLRLYFERKLRDAEESHREDLDLLHQRLREVGEHSFFDFEDVSWFLGFVEEVSKVEGKAHLDQLMLQLQKHKEGIVHLRQQLEEKYKEERHAFAASLETHYKEMHLAEMAREKRQHCLDLEELRTSLTEDHRKEMIKVRLQSAQDAARQVEAEVAERVLALEEDHKVRVAQLQSKEELISRLTEEVGLAKTEKAELQEKLQREICLKAEAEKMRSALAEDHQREVRKLQEEIQQIKDEEDHWQVRSREAQEKLAALTLELTGKAEQEQQALRKAFDLRVTELEQLRDRQAADITRLEQTLRQREESQAQDLEAATRRLREDCASELRTSQGRFLEEQKQMTQKFTNKQDALLRELQEKHAGELQVQSHQLQERYRQQTESLTTELQSKHREDTDALRASLQAQHRAQLDARVAELQAQHHEDTDALRASLQAQHQAQLDARVAELQAQHHEDTDALRASLQAQHQAQLDSRVAELQAQHCEDIDSLRASLQAQHRAQLDARVAELQAQHHEDLDARVAELQAQHREDLDARVAELQAQHREDTDALRASLQAQHQAQLDARVAELQAQHAAGISELEAKHLSNLDSLESSYLSEIQTIQEEHSHALEQLQGRLVEQLREQEAKHEVLLAQKAEKHQREMQLAQENLRIELTTNHVEKLKALATELQDAHQEDLQAALHSQRCVLEEENHKTLDRLGEEVLRMEQQHREALRELKDIHVAELDRQRAEAGQQLQEELSRLRAQHAHEREEDARVASAEGEEARRRQELLFEQEMALLKGQSEVLEQQVAQLKDKLETEKLLAVEREKAQALCQQEKEALTSQLQEQSSLILQLKEKVLSLNNEVADTHGELEKLQERREREHEEGTNLISLLRSDMGHTQDERKALQETNQRLLSLFGDTLKAAIAMKSQISKRIGVCLDEESTPLRMQGQRAQDMGQLPGDASPPGSIPHLEFDQTLPECDETLLAVSDISSHVRESFFLSPEVTVECEQPIRRIYQSLGAAVDNLLEMILDSSKQLEETRELHARFEMEFNRKNQETAQAVRQHQELMDCLNQESAAKNQLALELHKAEGLAEGYKAEKAALEEALSQKEKSEHHLAVELENLKAQFQGLTREQARLKEEQSLLLRQKERLIVEAEEKAAGVPVGTVAPEDSGLLKEVEHLVKEQSESKRQSEKDCSSLRSQMRVLERELEEQLSHGQELAQQAAEIQDLQQQIVSLDKHLRNQRQFMDEQAVEREHERDEFQQEIRKLEEQLKHQPAPKSQLWGEPLERESLEFTPEVESLQRKLRAKTDELNELVIKKELAERQLAAQKDEIRNLEDTNAEIKRKVSCLEEELERQKKIGKELKQDKEALQEQQMNNLIQISSLQSKLDEAKHLPPTHGSPNEDDLKEQLKAEQAALLLKESEVLSLEEELEQLKNNLTSKNDEILQLNLELALQNNQISSSIQELSAENADLKAFLQSKEKEIVSLNEQIKELQHEVEHAVEPKVMEDSSEIEELKAVIENLRESQERLRKEKLEEVEQLHEVIEKLQQELSLPGPVLHEGSDSQGDSDSSQAENLQRELQKGLFSFQAASDHDGARELPDPRVKQLQDELEALLAAKEALAQLLEDKESQFRRDLQSVHAASTEQLGLVRRRLSLKESEAKRAASYAQHWKTAFLEKEAEACALTRELEVLASACSHLERELEHKYVPDSQEPSELQMLNRHQACGPQCQVQIQNHWKEAGALSMPRMQGPRRLPPGAPAQEAHWSRQVSRGGHCAPATTEDECGQDTGPWQLAAAPQGHCGHGLIQQKPMESYPWHKGDLMTQVRHIQEKLHHLIQSISHGDNSDAEDRTWLHPRGLSERPAVASPPQRPHSRVSWTAQSSVDSGPPASQGPVSNMLCPSWGPADNTNGQDPPGQVRHKFKFDQSLESFPSSPSRNPCDADPRTPDCSYLEEPVAALKAPALMQSRDSPPPDEGGAFSLGPSEGSAQASPSSPCSAEKGSIQHFRDTILDTDTSLLGSPELVRKDSTLEGLPSIHLTPLSQTADLQSPDLAWRSLALQDCSGYLAYPALLGLGITPPASQSLSCREKSQPDASHDVERRLLEKDVEDFIITPTDSQDLQSTVAGLGEDSDGHDISQISDFPDKLKQDSKRSGPAHTRLVAQPQKSGMVERPFKPMKDKLEMQSRQMKALLKMVCDESQQILVLSKAEASAPELGPDPLHIPLDCFQKERQGLLDAVQALKDYLTKAPPRGEKEPSEVGFDWGDFLQAVQEVLEKERHVLKMELQAQLCKLDSGDERSLLEKLEDLVKEQGELQKKTLENLHLSDRSLLSEIQALHAQLRMTQLQNQEKLQQLYEALTNVEDHGSKQEYQFRRQVELLEYKVEQEKCIVSDLQKTLTEEQEKRTENQKVLLAAQNTAQELQAELDRCKQEKETACQALRDAQEEAAHLRSMLEAKERDLKKALDVLQGEKQKAKELQALLEDEQRQSSEKSELSSKAIEELQASLDKQRSQNGQLAVSLQHEQAEKDNLKKELQIESSRCEALLCQERGQVCELQRALEAERGHAAELSAALTHERLLTEQLSKRAGEACTQKEAQLQHAFVRKLKEEKARAAELQALLEDARQQSAAVKKQRELEVQAHREELRKEKEGWQRELELQRQRDEHKIQQLQQMIAELEKDKGFVPSRPWPERGAGAALPPDTEKLKEHHEQLENVRQQLLHAVGLLTSFMNQTVNRTISDWMSSNEKAVMSLLLTLEELKSELMSSLPQEEEVAALGPPPVVTWLGQKHKTGSLNKKTTQAQISLIDVLLKENGSLTKALSTMTQEKVELCRTVSKLEKTLKHHLQKGCGHNYKFVDRIGTLQKADKAAWKQQKMALPSSRHGEPGMVKATLKSETPYGGSTCRVKMEKLYLHFLRAESFRKALIYQKRYLLLLIGGFQDSEQETLSMIAHLGVFPSKMDKRTFASRPFTKFRTAVRVVIAILRLRFLVKKWQELDRRGMFTQSSELDSVPEEAVEVSRPPPPLSSSPSLPETTSSPPTQDLPPSSLKMRRSPSPAYHLWDRTLTSPSSSVDVYDSSQDPEHSLTENIHHLEIIQQRLRGIQPELSSKKSGHQRSKKSSP
ncbi:pericentrin [Dromiciops gliroides]|uniref:pericentrin n=1 Tax=Dromiciops gliroides TaxID=33562 RepID=UPI001CC6FEE3|nr:pericentrin [Dromiciops gliroides]